MSICVILALESSCDETAISILKSSAEGLELLSNEISSQVKLHAKWGGVVPNLAAREHVKNITPLLEESLRNAGVTIQDIDLIAITQGPGLIPALMIGTNFAKTLSYLWNKPLLGIHHIEGHIYANFVKLKNQESRIKNLGRDSKFMVHDSSKMQFPALVLVVSGGHTQLVLMKDHLQYEIIGQTVDDAVGEAFDKVARILGIGYPGGPAVAQHATNFQFPTCLPTRQVSNFQTNPNDKISNNKNRYETQNTKYKIQFPRPMMHKKNYNFSFSGLKTAVLYETKKNTELLKNKNYVAEICHEFQQACVDVLVSKTIKATEQYNPKTIMLAGGVSANKELRKQLGSAIEKYDLSNQTHLSYIIPDLALTGDNAAMIAAAAAFRWEKMSDTQKKKLLSNWKTLQPDANLKMK